MRKINHIFIVLVLAIAFIISVELVKFVRENIFYFLLPLLALFAVIFWKNRKKDDVYLTGSIFVYFLLGLILAKTTLHNIEQSIVALRFASVLSFLLLNLVLLIGPWSWFSERILRVYYFRRHLGVSALLAASLHIAVLMPKYFNNSMKDALSEVFVFYGFTGFVIMICLGLTSWDYIQKKVKNFWWKIIHAVLLLWYLSVAYYTYTIHVELHTNFNYLVYNFFIPVSIFVLFWLIIAPYSIVSKLLRNRVWGWKQLHVLIYVVYFGLLLHVYISVLIDKPLWLNLLFFLLPAFVVGSHIVGWIKKFREDKIISHWINTIGSELADNAQFTENGKTFVAIAKVDEFEENRGRKFFVNNKAIAVFKTTESTTKEQKFTAVTNVCKHQSGPIYRGKVIHSMVQCPWHHWTYGLKDGCTLGKERFCLTKYETRVKDGILFVSKEKISK